MQLYFWYFLGPVYKESASQDNRSRASLSFYKISGQGGAENHFQAYEGKDEWSSVRDYARLGLFQWRFYENDSKAWFKRSGTHAPNVLFK